MFFDFWDKLSRFVKHFLKTFLTHIFFTHIWGVNPCFDRHDMDMFKPLGDSFWASCREDSRGCRGEFPLKESITFKKTWQLYVLFSTAVDVLWLRIYLVYVFLRKPVDQNRSKTRNFDNLKLWWRNIDQMFDHLFWWSLVWSLVFSVCFWSRKPLGRRAPPRTSWSLPGPMREPP